MAANGTLCWRAFGQRSVEKLIRDASVEQMVRNVGGDPAEHKTKRDMTEWVLDREKPLGVLRLADNEEIYCNNRPVVLPPRQNTLWFADAWNSRTGVMTSLAPSTEEVVMRR